MSFLAGVFLGVLRSLLLACLAIFASRSHSSACFLNRYICIPCSLLAHRIQYLCRFLKCAVAVGFHAFLTAGGPTLPLSQCLGGSSSVRMAPVSEGQPLQGGQRRLATTFPWPCGDGDGVGDAADPNGALLGPHSGQAPLSSGQWSWLGSRCSPPACCRRLWHTATRYSRRCMPAACGLPDHPPPTPFETSNPDHHGS